MDNKTERKVPGFGKIMLASGVGTLIVLVLIGLFKLLVFFGILGSIGSDSGVVVAKDEDRFDAACERAHAERA